MSPRSRSGAAASAPDGRSPVAENPIRLGTRGSALALAQARSVAARLPRTEIVEITTSGDRGSGPGDKSRFTKEIEEALLEGRIDIAIHSAKDVPAEIPDGLAISGVPAREDPRDAYVGDARSLEEVPEDARIGTSSLRRRSQLLALRPDLELIELRGNVDTRLRRLDAGDYDGLVLAAAGLRRLGRADRIAFEFEPAVLTPSPGQGALALETRRPGSGTSEPRPSFAASGSRSASSRQAAIPRSGSSPGSTAHGCRCAGSAAFPTARSGSATRSTATRAEPTSLRRSVGCWRSE